MSHVNPEVVVYDGKYAVSNCRRLAFQNYLGLNFKVYRAGCCMENMESLLWMLRDECIPKLITSLTLVSHMLVHKAFCVGLVITQDEGVCLIL